MNKYAILFLFGIILGVIIQFVENIWNSDFTIDSTALFIQSFTSGGLFANLSYYIILMIILPFVAIPDLKKKLNQKALYVYAFVCGITFFGAISGIYTLLLIY